jgi:pyridoxamine 5'-phosphate oxidase
MKSALANARLVIFRIAHGEAYFLTLENNLREHEAPHLKF